jgi:chlorobactene glucosyltransferase
MIYLGYFILIFTLIQLLVALTNLLTETHLPRTGVVAGRLVSVLIPARNEEKNIAGILQDIRDQAYENTEVIVFNDQSEDRTAEIVTSFILWQIRQREVFLCSLMRMCALGKTSLAIPFPVQKNMAAA